MRTLSGPHPTAGYIVEGKTSGASDTYYGLFGEKAEKEKVRLSNVTVIEDKGTHLIIDISLQTLDLRTE